VRGKGFWWKGWRGGERYISVDVAVEAALYMGGSLYRIEFYGKAPAAGRSFQCCMLLKSIYYLCLLDCAMRLQEFAVSIRQLCLPFVVKL